jgi:hypothetical protein
MRFHPKGLVVLGLFIILGLTIGAVGTVWVFRAALVSLVVVVFLEIVINMVRHSDMRIRSRLLDWLAGQVTTFVWPTQFPRRPKSS